MSVEGAPRPLPEPFMVAATQNPIEYEGTYPLPEAQLDRFLLKLTVPLPNRDEELGVLRAHHHGFDPRDLSAAGVRPVATAADLAAGREAVGRVAVAEPVLGYIVDLCRATRVVAVAGAGRLAARRDRAARRREGVGLAVRAGLRHPRRRQGVARPTLRHRVRLRPEAELEGVTVDPSSTRCWPPCRPRADHGHLADRPAARPRRRSPCRCGRRRGWAAAVAGCRRARAVRCGLSRSPRRCGTSR